MKIKKKTFKSLKDKYKHYIKQTTCNIDTLQERLSKYSPEYGPKEDLHRDMFRYIAQYNLLVELLDDIETLGGKR